MNADREFLKELIDRGQYADKGYFEYAHIVATLLDKQLHESLRQLVDGPVYDGDVISKHHRNELISLGLGIRVCKGGSQGFTGATYFAFSVNEAIEQIKTGQRAA